MIAAVLTAIAAFIATGIDEMFVLTILFVHAGKTKSTKDVYIGQQLGMNVLLALSILAVFGIALIAEKWVGLLGLLPIIQGVRFMIHGDDDDEDEDEEIVEKSDKFHSLILSVAFIAIAGGGEELAIYIPYFASLSTRDLIITLITFNLLVPIWCIVCQKAAKMKVIYEIVEKYERILIPIVFIGLGLFVILENKTIGFLVEIIRNSFLH